MKHSHFKPSRGLALFEILAALVVLSVSFLGTALLLAKTAKEERSAVFLGRAATLASEMAERIRSSPAAIDHYVVNQTYSSGSGTVTAPACGGFFSRPGTSPTTLPACLDAPGAAAYDLASWLVQLQSNLPGGVGRIDKGIDANRRVIVIGWSEPVIDRQSSGTSVPVNQQCPGSFAAPETVRCYVMEVRL